MGTKLVHHIISKTLINTCELVWKYGCMGTELVHHIISKTLINTYKLVWKYGCMGTKLVHPHQLQHPTSACFLKIFNEQGK